VLAAFFIAFTGLLSAQNWQFGFDLSGNLLTRTPESTVPPQILSQPQQQIVSPGELASFFVVAADTRGLTYQWLFYGTNYPGATSDVLLITNVSAANQGPYSVVLSNGSGSVTSSVAQLYIDSRGVGMPDSWQLQYFGNLNQNPTGDFDGDGVSNLQEFLDGTNPTNANSARFRISIDAPAAYVNESPTRVSYTNGEVVTLTATGIAPYSFRAWAGDVNTTNNPITLTMTNNKSVIAYAGPFNIVWTNSASGDWNRAANWFPNLVPGTFDTVVINTAVTVTLSNSVECASLTLGAPGILPTLTVTGNLTLDGPCYWYAGTISVSGTTFIKPGASLTCLNPSTLFFSSGTLENDGTLLWSGANDISLGNTVFTNAPGGLFLAQIQSAANLTGSGSRFDNAGTFRTAIGPATTVVLVPFNNFGTVDLQSGTLECRGAFNQNGTVTLAAGTTNIQSGGGTSSGSFAASANSVVAWTGTAFTPAYTLNLGAQLNGAGLYRLDGSTVNFNTDIAVQNLELTVTVGNTSTTLNGTGLLTISNVLNWVSASMNGSGSAKTLIAPGATLNFLNPSTAFLSSRTLENAGTMLWTSGGIQANSATITNRSGALFLAQNSASLSGSSAEFDNAGTFRKSASAGTTTLGILANNFGLIDIQTGTLLCNNSTFANNGSVTLAAGTTNRLSGGGSATGSFTAPASALVEWTGAARTPAFTLNPGAQLNGAGLYRMDGSTVTLNTDFAIQNLALVNSGTGSSTDINGPGTLTINNSMTWTAGDLEGGGKLLVAGGATLNFNNPNAVFLSSRSLENAGTVLYTGAGSLNLSSTFITNRPGGLFDVQSATSLSGSSSRFDNAGTFRKSVSTGMLTFTGLPLDNYGTVDLRLGFLALNASGNANYVPAANALLTCLLTGTAPGNNYGQLQSSSTLNLNGGLAITLALTNGYLPATNDTFVLVSAGTRNGAFSSFSYPSNVVTMVLSNSPTTVVARATGVTVPPPVLLTPVLSGTNVLLTWTAFSNITYRLQSNPNLAPTNWNAVSGDVTSLSNLASKVDSLTPTNNFYRVRVMQ
jgi:hypothetical protein